MYVFNVHMCYVHIYILLNVYTSVCGGEGEVDYTQPPSDKVFLKDNLVSDLEC